MKICIITDDNAGFTQDEVKKLGIGIVPMPVIINGEIYFENKNIDQEQFYLKQNGGSDIITSQPSPGSILQLWDEKLKDFEQIVHIPMSSGLSEECNTAKMLAKELGAEYTEVQFADVSSPYIGQTSVEIQNAFKQIKKQAEKHPDKKFLVGFNEIDALLV